MEKAAKLKAENRQLRAFTILVPSPNISGARLRAAIRKSA
jgi:hypothetical protein